MADSYTLKIWDKVNKFIKENKLFKSGDRILLAVSGGPDSMMMLDFFVKTKKQNPVVVFHLNHMIRKDSHKDENIVKNYAEKYELNAVFKKVNVGEIAKKKNKNLEMTAREIRYKLLYETAKKYRCKYVATAHNLDENTETVLFNIIRGNSLKTLTGIPVKRKLKNNIYVIRPVMCLKKEEILKYLKKNKIKFATDITNFDTKYTRNWIRHKLIPLIEKKQPNFSENLLRFSKEIEKLINKD